MPEMLAPIVVSRRGDTTHEDTRSQANRAKDCVWQTLVEQRQQRVMLRAVPTHLSHAVLTHQDKDHSAESLQALRDALAHDTLSSNWTRFAEALAEPFEVAEDLRIVGDSLSLRELRENFVVEWKDVVVAEFTLATGKTSTLVSWWQAVRHATIVEDESNVEWTQHKNQRRCQLIDTEIDGTLSAADKAELEQLQAEMLAYRRKVAPLPLEELRELHQDLLRRASNKTT